MDKIFPKILDVPIQLPSEISNQTGLCCATKSYELTDLSQDEYAIMKINEKFLEDIKETISLSNKLITKDISNYKIKDKENLIKIHRSMNLIIDNLSNEIDKIDQMKLYDLNFNVRDNLTKLKVNLIKLKDMCNNIYQKYE
jgi:hypothetical protein